MRERQKNVYVLVRTMCVPELLFAISFLQNKKKEFHSIFHPSTFLLLTLLEVSQTGIGFFLCVGGIKKSGWLISFSHTTFN